MPSKKTISIFGATGSVGRSTADVVLAHPDRFDVHAVTANTNAKALAELAIKLKAKTAVVADPNVYEDLKEELSGTEITCAAGEDALCEAAEQPVDWTMMAIVGMAGLKPLLKVLEQGNIVGIANKEPLVAAGPLVLEAAKQSGAKIIPVDSEHNAIFQLLEDNGDTMNHCVPRVSGSESVSGITNIDGTGNKHVRKIVLTASGGPFRKWSYEQMVSATPDQAIAHPNWSMGPKISVDSATMVNKALEVIEAHYLFGFTPKDIDVLVHPQSVVHGLVEYVDSSFGAILAPPDMKTPISHALGWPERLESPGRCLNILDMKELTFEPVDEHRFPAVSAAYKALEEGHHACLTFNAANEVAVEAFLQGEISFTEIADIVLEMTYSCQNSALTSLEAVLLYDRDVREAAKSYILKKEPKKAVHG